MRPKSGRHTKGHSLQRHPSEQNPANKRTMILYSSTEEIEETIEKKRTMRSRRVWTKFFHLYLSFLFSSFFHADSSQSAHLRKMRVAKTESGNTQWSRNECTTLVRSCFRASFKVTPMPSKANSEEKVFGKVVSMAKANLKHRLFS